MHVPEYPPFTKDCIYRMSPTQVRLALVLNPFDPEAAHTWKEVVEERLWETRLIVQSERPDGTVFLPQPGYKSGYFECNFESAKDADYFVHKVESHIHQITKACLEDLRLWVSSMFEGQPRPRILCCVQGPIEGIQEVPPLPKPPWRE